MAAHHPERAKRGEHREDAQPPPRNVHWGAVAGALLLGLGALLRKQRRALAGRARLSAARGPG